ncbi:hypothetical protein [Geodermatophilus sp. DF01_2]|nr:hypothetical protein [Geodermatophilus sp. DF01_2]
MLDRVSPSPGSGHRTTMELPAGAADLVDVDGRRVDVSGGPGRL